MRHLACSVLVAGLSGPFVAVAATLEVEPGERQTYEGFGFSIQSFISKVGPQYGGFSEEMLNMMYEDLHANMLRMWVTPKEGGPDHEVATFEGVMVENGVYEDAVRHGVEYFFTAPEGYSQYATPEPYARDLADMNERIVKDFGVELHTVGVENEPGCGNRKHLNVSEGKQLIISLREELEERGLGHLKILSPDFCQNNNYAKSWIDEVSSDPEGNAAYDYISTHSYGITGDEEMYALMEKHDKEGWWQTEAGGGESANSTGAAANAAGRLISDLNHGVTHWVWFLGCCGGSAHYLFSGNENPNMHYHYFKLVNEALTFGTVLRHTTLDGREMGKSRRSGTAVNAAVGVRPDGKWAAAVINDGGTTQLTLDIAELSDEPSLTFALCRVKGTSRDCGETATLSAGSGQFSVAGDEVVTLVAQQPTEPRTR